MIPGAAVNVLLKRLVPGRLLQALRAGPVEPAAPADLQWWQP